MANKSYYKSKFNLRMSDYSCYDKIYPHTILDLFQEVASKHAEILNMGFESLKGKGLIWVLLRTKFEIIKDPPLHSNVEVMTWPKEKGKVDFDREYLILDEKGNTLVKGISKWVIVNFNTRKISLSRDISYDCEIYKKENYPNFNGKIDDFSIDNLPYFEEKTDYISVDHNKHINNIIYAKYVMNILSLKENNNIISFEINYLKEANVNQIIRNYYKIENNIVFVKGVLENDTCYLAKVVLKMGL